jgi:hypothetical protein
MDADILRRRSRGVEANRRNVGTHPSLRRSPEISYLRSSAFICVHLRSSAFICVYLRLKS